VERDSRVDGCVLAADTVISPGQSLRGVVAIPESLDIGEVDLSDADLVIQGLASSPGHYARSRAAHAMYQFVKRAMDMAAALAGLVLLLPVIVLVALAVKITSPGPIFFRQKCCGRNGREFKMVKFRTMVKDAEAMQTDLRPKNEVDGPTVQMENDPPATN